MPNILVVMSSYRKNSNSSALGEAIMQGAREAGHMVKSIDIASLDIKPCRGCGACTTPAAKGCVQKDDMREAYPLVHEANTIVFVSPIYWFNMSGQTKVFIDRLFAVAVQKDQNGKSALAGKKLAAAFAFEGDDPFDSGCINAIRCLQDICAYTGSPWGGVVYGTANAAGEMKENPAAIAKALEFGKNL